MCCESLHRPMRWPRPSHVIDGNCFAYSASHRKPDPGICSTAGLPWSKPSASATSSSRGEFCAKIRNEIVKVLHQTLVFAASELDMEVVQNTLRAALSLQCEVGPMLSHAGHMVVALCASAANCKLQPISRLAEVLEGAESVAKAAQKPLETFCDLTPFVESFSQKCMQEIRQANEGGSEPVPSLVKKVVDVRMKFRQPDLLASGSS
eukprot:g24166.t1